MEQESHVVLNQLIIELNHADQHHLELWCIEQQEVISGTFQQDFNQSLNISRVPFHSGFIVLLQLFTNFYKKVL